jgi:hypothetical protein
MKAPTVLIAAGLALATVASACAPKKPPAAPAPDADRPVAGFNIESFGLDLAGPSETDPASPGRDAFQGGIAALNPLYSDKERELDLRNTLILSRASGAHAFFVWPEGEGTARITQASFAVRDQSADNRLGGEPTYQLASHDRDGKRYFIPLERAISGRIQDIGPADDQILLIRLELDGGGVVDLTLRFRVAGPLVPLEVIRDEPLGPSVSRDQFLARGASVPVRRVTFRNPMARRVNYWLRTAPARTGLWLSGQETYNARDNQHTVHWRAPLQMDQLIDLRSNQAGRPAAGWVQVPFGPGEQVTLQWTGLTQGCGTRYGSITGVLADGDWAMDTRVTDASAWPPALEVEGSPESLSINSGPLTFNAHSVTGSWGSYTDESYDCR